MEQIIIVSLPPEEWQKYKIIRLEALQKEPTAFANTYDDEAKYEDKKWIGILEKSKNRDTEIALFAKNGDKIIGFIGAFWVTKEKMKHVAHIYGTYVDSEYRGQGVGKILMEAVINELKSLPHIKKIKIEVNAQNTVAFNLYQKMGFKVIGKAEKELKVNGVFYDEILMEQLI